MGDFIDWLLDATGFMPRTACGADFTPALIANFRIADTVIFLAYQAIPAILIWATLKRRRRGFRISPAFAAYLALTTLFVVSCGWTHLIDMLMYSTPMYRLNAAVKDMCAVFSVLTVFALPVVASAWIGMPTDADVQRLQEEIDILRDEVARDG